MQFGSKSIKAPNQDLLRFLKALKDYERVDELISRAALSKFCQYLWYLSDEIAVISVFDEEVDEETKRNIVEKLQKESFRDSRKLDSVPSKEEMFFTLYGSISSFYLKFL